MPFEIKLVTRFLLSRKRSLVKFTSAAAIAGLIAGVASLIIAQALARGFQMEMQEKLLANTAHIAVFRHDRLDINDWDRLINELKRIGNVKGIDPAASESIFLIGPSFVDSAVLQTSPLAEAGAGNGLVRVSVGSELAVRFGFQIGGEAEVVLLKNGTEPQRSRVQISEIFKTGLYDYDSTIVRVSTQKFATLNGDNQFSPRSLNIQVKDIYRSDETAQMISVALGNEYRVIDWQEANRPLFAALSLEKKAALAIISLIILIAVLNITTTLALLVNERRLDIAVLRTCGAKTRSLVLIFVLEGMLLGLIGVAGGTILGLCGSWLANYGRLISLPAEVYSLSYIPLRSNVGDILTVAAVSLGLCFIATIYPALAASRMKPMENFRIC